MVMGGFLAGCADAPPEEAPPAAEAPAPAAPAGPDVSAATTIPGESLQGDPGPYVGQLVRLEGLSVTSPLGTQGFWLELPNRNPFLVSISDDARARGAAAGTGQRVNVVGTIVSMNDSILTAWTTAARINEGDRLAAEFASHFLEAQTIEVAPGMD
jgi:hypothetical protein